MHGARGEGSSSSPLSMKTFADDWTAPHRYSLWKSGQHPRRLKHEPRFRFVGIHAFGPWFGLWLTHSHAGRAPAAVRTRDRRSTVPPGKVSRPSTEHGVQTTDPTDHPG